MKPEPVNKLKGRWADEDLILEYAYEAIEDDRYKEHCCDLWFRAEVIKSAVEWLKENVDLSWRTAGLIEGQNEKSINNTIKFMIELIDEAFEDLQQTRTR